MDLEKIKQQVKDNSANEELRDKCPNCREYYDGIECRECGFDTGCHDINWD